MPDYYKPKVPPDELLEQLRSELKYFGGKLWYINDLGECAFYLGELGTINSAGYRIIRRKRRGKYYNLLVHHIVWFLCNGEWPKTQLDHRNRKPLDNRIENLRETDSIANMLNRSLFRRKNKLPRGVSRVRAGYAATITVRGIHKYLGFSKLICPAFEIYKTEYEKQRGTAPGMFY